MRENNHLPEIIFEKILKYEYSLRQSDMEKGRVRWGEILSIMFNVFLLKSIVVNSRPIGVVILKFNCKSLKAF